jgi:hypothetical protein
MQKIELTVNEFMAIMGALDEVNGDQGPVGDGIYDEWFKQWKDLDTRLEKLDMMARADMLFDGKLTINAISEEHFQELINAVRGQIAMHKQLIEDEDEDADPEDLASWQERLKQLDSLHVSASWVDQS